LALPAQEGIQRAKVKKLDLDRKVVTLTVAGKDREFRLTEETRVLGAAGKDLKARFRGIKDGMEVMFKATRKGGHDVLVGLKPAGGEAERGTRPKVDTAKLKPLPELGAGEYQGFKGGLYPDGKNERPAAHEAAGVALARQVRPLGADGKPS